MEDIMKEETEKNMKEKLFCSWDFECNIGCAPLECTFKLPSRIGFEVAAKHVRTANMDGQRVDLYISHSNCLRTMASSQQCVEAIKCTVKEWDTNVSNYMAKMCKVVKRMPYVKVFAMKTWKILDGKEWAEALFELLAMNSTLIEFYLTVVCKIESIGLKLLVDALLQSQALQTFVLELCNGSLSLESVQPILGELCRYAKSSNNVLTNLHIYDNLVSKVGAEYLATLICNNKALKTLQLDVSNGECKGLHNLWGSLGSNTTLETLVIDCHKDDYMNVGSLHLEVLVKVLVPNSSYKLQPNSSLRNLFLFNTSIRVEDLTTLLQFNNRLLYLQLFRVKDLMVEYCKCAYENVEKLFTSLQSNASLESLDLRGCTAIGGKMVLGMIMDMLLHNHTIKEIHLDGTPLERNSDNIIIKAELNKREEQNWGEVVQEMHTINPDSARLFLCGKGKAGKTTLSNTWRAPSLSTTTPVKTNAILRFNFVAILRKVFACMAQQPKTKNVVTFNSGSTSMKNERTRGIEVHTINVQDVNISIWDMAGQEEYHAFHDWIIPNRSATGNCCMYVILCDPTSKTDPYHIRHISHIEKELLYWLQFVASNTRRSFAYRPHVLILFTHVDLWGEEEYSKYKLVEVIDEFRLQFQDLLEVDTHDNNSCFINANSPHDGHKVVSIVHHALRPLLERLPKEVKACKVLQSIIHEKNTRGDDKPFLEWNEFLMMCEEVDGLKSSEHIQGAKLAKRREFVASSLHDGGFIIYFKGIDIVILNPHWFCHDIMGELLFKCTKLNPNLEMIKDGVISKKGLQEVFTNSLATKSHSQHFDVFLHMMMKLQFCYEQDDNHIMVPCTLQDSGELNWHRVFSERSGVYNHVGTRLAARDEILTMLTPGFFPRLQVFLHTKFCTPTYKCCKDIISFMENDIEIIIACDDGSINIMSRSQLAKDHMVHKKIINSINELRSISTLGCPGVILEEYAMRPQCVKQWSRGMDVHLQVVSKSELRRNVLLCPDLDYQHHWVADEQYGIGCDSVKELLGDEEWGEVLQVKENISKKIATEVEEMIKSAIDDEQIGDPCHTIVSNQQCGVQSSSMTNEFYLVLNKMEQNHKETQHTLEGMNRKMDRHHEEMKGILARMENKIISSQEKLVSMVCSNINELMRFLKQLQQSRVPKLAYFSKSQNGGLKHLLTRMVLGIASAHLHLMCEHQSGFHIVDAQHGCEVRFSSNQSRKFGTIMYWGLVVVTLLLKVGAHVTAGAGAMVPDLTKDMMLILDTPGLVDLAQPNGPLLEGLPPELRCNPTITDTDKRMAEDWLIQLLKSKCDSNEIHEIFELNKVVYTKKNGKHAGVIAWVCDGHKERGEREGTLECV